MKHHLSPGQRATIVFCLLVLLTGVTALALFGAPAVFPAIAGSLLTAGPLSVFVYVVYLRREDAPAISEGDQQ